MNSFVAEGEMRLTIDVYRLDQEFELRHGISADHFYFFIQHYQTPPKHNNNESPEISVFTYFKIRGFPFVQSIK